MLERIVLLLLSGSAALNRAFVWLMLTTLLHPKTLVSAILYDLFCSTVQPSLSGRNVVYSRVSLRSSYEQANQCPARRRQGSSASQRMEDRGFSQRDVASLCLTFVTNCWSLIDLKPCIGKTNRGCSSLIPAFSFPPWQVPFPSWKLLITHAKIIWAVVCQGVIVYSW